MVVDQQDQIRQDQSHLEAVVAEALEIAKGLGAGLAEVSIRYTFQEKFIAGY